MADIVERLERWAVLKVGEPVPVSEENWGDRLSADLRDAIAEIKRLRSVAGAVSTGRDLAELRKQIEDARRKLVECVVASEQLTQVLNG